MAPGMREAVEAAVEALIGLLDVVGEPEYA